MVHICSQCGALLLEEAENCSFCDAPLVDQAEAPEPVASGVVASAGSPREARRAITERVNNPDSNEPDWRREVARRLHDYRVRRGRPDLDDSQSGLPFAEELRAPTRNKGLRRTMADLRLQQLQEPVSLKAKALRHLAKAKKATMLGARPLPVT